MAEIWILFRRIFSLTIHLSCNHRKCKVLWINILLSLKVKSKVMIISTSVFLGCDRDEVLCLWTWQQKSKPSHHDKSYCYLIAGLFQWKSHFTPLPLSPQWKHFFKGALSNSVVALGSKSPLTLTMLTTFNTIKNYFKGAWSNLSKQIFILMNGHHPINLGFKFQLNPSNHLDTWRDYVYCNCLQFTV